MSKDIEKQPLKSRLVVAFSDQLESDDTKAFARHFRELLGLDESTREKCVATLSEARQARTSFEEERVVDSFAPEDPSQRAMIAHSLKVLDFLTDALLSDKIPADDHKNWADDLVTIGWLNPKSRHAFDSVLDKLTNEYLSELEAQESRRRAEGGVLPVFKSLGITVEARAVRKDRYRWGMPLEGETAYRPEIIGTTMKASVHIGVDEGFPESFYFQMGEADIDNFIASLTAVKREMAALRKYLSLDDEGKVAPNA